jgi:hypothetical protein
MFVGPVAYRRLAAAVVLAVSLAGCQYKLLPSQSQSDNAGFESYEAVQVAYGRIRPGATKTDELATLGFDVHAASNVEVLSYLGVIERFMPRDSIKMDDLDPEVRACLQARIDCSAYIFRPLKLLHQRTGNVPLDLLGFRRTTETRGWSAEILFVVHNDRVIYKLWAGKPHMDSIKQVVQPLGPFQDLSGVAGGAVANVIVP